MTTLQHPRLKDPIWKDARQCFDELQKDDEAHDEALNATLSWIGKLLEKVNFDAVANIFDSATDIEGFLENIAKDFVTDIGAKAGEKMKMTSFVTSEAKEWVVKNCEGQVDKFGEPNGSKKWSPLANAVYKVGKKACVTILPILVKGTVAAAMGPAFAASAPLWMLGVIITYSVAQEKLDRAKVNARLSYKLINNLNKCRAKALTNILDREARETATMAKLEVDDEDKLVLRVLVDKEKVVPIKLGDLRVIAAILTTNKLSLKDMNGNVASLYSQGSDVEWPLTRIFIFLIDQHHMRIPDEATAKKIKLDSVANAEIKNGIDTILQESGFEIAEGGGIKEPHTSLIGQKRN